MTAAIVARLSQENVAAAIRRVQQMSQAEKLRVADSIYRKQPNLLASVLVQRKFGASGQKLEALQASAATRSPRGRAVSLPLPVALLALAPEAVAR